MLNTGFLVDSVHTVVSSVLPDLPKSWASRSRTPPTVLPRPPVRQRARTEERRPSLTTQGAGGAVACVRAVGPFERRTARSMGRRHAPAARSSRWSRTTSGMSLHSSRETVSTCEGTGGASVNTQTGGRGGCCDVRARRLAVHWAQVQRLATGRAWQTRRAVPRFAELANSASRGC